MTAITHTFQFTGAGEDFGPRADGIVTLHTFENSDLANDIAAAIRGAEWQDLYHILGSYNRLIAVNGVLSTVPDNHASGGINPGSAFWHPAPWLYGFLPSEEIANPNYFTQNLCAMGRRDHYDANGWPAEIIDGFARSIIDEERRIGRGVVVTNHSDFQSNRTDAGAICIDLVMKRYAELMASPASKENDMPNLTTYALETIRIDAAAAIRSAPTTQGAPLFLSGRESSAVRVGTLVNAESEWSVYYLADRKVWGYTAKQNVLRVEPYPNTALPTPAPADCSTQDATIEAQAQRIANLLTAQGERDAVLVAKSAAILSLEGRVTKKNAALDVALAHEQPHVALAANLAAARVA